MSKIISEALYKLIRSLTKSEKRQFKIYGQRIASEKDKKFIKLFDVIAGMKTYDETIIRKKIPEISKLQLPNAKAHLYHQILKCLRFTLANKEGKQKIMEMTENARILYNKCLYADALSVIDKAKKKAKEYDSKILLLEILELEKSALRQGMQESLEKRADYIINETQLTAKSIQNINIFSNLALKLNTYYQKQGFISSNNDLLKIEKYFKQNIPVYDEKKLSFNELVYLYYALTGYYLYISNFKKAYEYACKWSDLFETYKTMKSNYIEMYIKALNARLVVENKLYKYTDFMQTHRKLVALKRDKEIVLTKNIYLNLFKTIYIHEINRHFMLGEFKSGTRIVSKLENELNKMISVLDKNTILIFYYKIACLYFGSSNFKTAIKWLNRIIHEPETNLREDLHSFARILLLICYFELGDHEMIEMNIRATYRFLLKKQGFVKYKHYIMSFLREVQNVISVNEVIEKFKKLKIRMERLQKDRFERRAFIYFDIISYLESKIENKSIQDKVKEKAQTKIQS
jgi:tetratricopeptide (TPR) repeat protein